MKLLSTLLMAAGLAWAPADLTLPVIPKSVRFALIGDSGTGEPAQFEVAREMAREHDAFPFDFVIMMGDNIYGGQQREDYQRKFEEPYAPLLQNGVKFYASLGNHDNPNQRFYKPFHMDGKRYYSFKHGNTQFFTLDSNFADRSQHDWLEKELEASKSTWKICFLHRPLYSHGRDHPPDIDLRRQLEPLFEKYGVQVVISGHDHSYERLKPQKGISYFVLGNSGQLRLHNLLPSAETAKAFDADQAFGMMEIAEDQLYFQIVSRKGETVDSGVLRRGAEVAHVAQQHR